MKIEGILIKNIKSEMGRKVMVVKNLYEEIKDTLKRKGKKVDDILWAGNREYKVNLDDFIKKSKETYYTQGYVDLQYPEDLIIRGEDFWIEVDEYEGSLGLEFKLIPTEPKKEIKLESLNQLWVKKELVGEDIEYTCITEYREYSNAQIETRKNPAMMTDYANDLEDIQELAKELNNKDKGLLVNMNEKLKNKRKEDDIYG